jgi:ABC-type dipeptide/oligopeptide/nickel transport system ATPase component
MLVEEIFTIIARINAEQGASMLLVEQNAVVAFAVAHYGYIMETGKVVIDGPVEKLMRDQDVREFYLGMGAGRAIRASATSSTTSAASAGCLEDAFPRDAARTHPCPRCCASRRA